MTNRYFEKFKNFTKSNSLVHCNKQFMKDTIADLDVSDQVRHIEHVNTIYVTTISYFLETYILTKINISKMLKILCPSINIVDI